MRSEATGKVRAPTAGADALFELGLSYSIGDGVPQDYVLAHKWLNLAAMNGSDRARSIRAEIAGCMTAAEIAEAQRLAREWRQTH
jgi:TPR repeat protein